MPNAVLIEATLRGHYLQRTFQELPWINWPQGVIMTISVGSIVFCFNSTSSPSYWRMTILYDCRTLGIESTVQFHAQWRWQEYQCSVVQNETGLMTSLPYECIRGGCSHCEAYLAQAPKTLWSCRNLTQCSSWFLLCVNCSGLFFGQLSCSKWTRTACELDSNILGRDDWQSKIIPLLFVEWNGHPTF